MATQQGSGDNYGFRFIGISHPNGPPKNMIWITMIIPNTAVSTNSPITPQNINLLPSSIFFSLPPEKINFAIPKKNTKKAIDPAIGINVVCTSEVSVSIRSCTLPICA